MRRQTVTQRFLATLLCLAIAGCTDVQIKDESAIIAEAAIQVERTVIMPEGADMLEDYVRYYAISNQHEKEIMIGIFTIPDWDRERERTPIQGLSGAYSVENDQKLPRVMDGGCGVVTIHFDLESSRLIGLTGSGAVETKLATCNGFA